MSEVKTMVVNHGHRPHTSVGLPDPCPFASKAQQVRSNLAEEDIVCSIDELLIRDGVEFLLVKAFRDKKLAAKVERAKRISQFANKNMKGWFVQ